MAKKARSTSTKITGDTPVDKDAIKAAARADRQDAAKTTKAAPKRTRQTTKRGDQAPESGTTKAERSAKAEKLFKDADEAAASGLPHTMTREQHENHVRRAALGY